MRRTSRRTERYGYGAGHVGLAVAMVLVLVLGATRGAAAGATTVKHVAIITPASRTNQGWDEQGVDNLTQVGNQLGVDVSVDENAGYDDITPVLQDLSDDGAQLIFCHASGYQTTCPDFAASSGVPVVVIENSAAVQKDLVSDIETQAQEAAYLAGVMAGNETRTGTVAIVVTGEPPTWDYMSVGFAEGLKASRPDAKLLYTSIGEGSYDDATGAKQATDTMLAAGADIVFGMGDGAAFGMIQSINAFDQGKPADQQARFIDVIGDKSAGDARNILLTSVLFDYTGAYTKLINDLSAGTFGSVYTMNVANNGVRLLAPPTPVKPETTAAVEAARQQIVGGQVHVSAIGDANGVHARLHELFP